MIAEWRQYEDGTWWASARVSAPSGNRIEILPALQVREPEIDWSRGRTADGTLGS